MWIVFIAQWPQNSRQNKMQLQVTFEKAVTSLMCQLRNCRDWMSSTWTHHQCFWLLFPPPCQSTILRNEQRAPDWFWWQYCVVLLDVCRSRSTSSIFACMCRCLPARARSFKPDGLVLKRHTMLLEKNWVGLAYMVLWVTGNLLPNQDILLLFLQNSSQIWL